MTGVLLWAIAATVGVLIWAALRDAARNLNITTPRER